MEFVLGALTCLGLVLIGRYAWNLWRFFRFLNAITEKPTKRSGRKS